MSQIKVGDLVQVVRCCCTSYVDVAPTFVVKRLENEGTLWMCSECSADLPEGMYAMATDNMGEGGIPLSWLKRIPPLPELESEKNKEGLSV